MNSRSVALIAVLTALSIGTNYAMMPFYNIKLMDIIVFVGGFCFGPTLGALIGCVSWVVYGTLNPLGFSLPIWATTMLSEAVYGVAGGISRKAFSDHSGNLQYSRIGLSVFFGMLGVLLTLVYDLITNVVFGYVYNWNVLFAVVVGFVPFGLIHVASNAFFFGIGCVPAIKAVSKVIGVDNFDVSKK